MATRKIIRRKNTGAIRSSARSAKALPKFNDLSSREKYYPRLFLCSDLAPYVMESNETITITLPDRLSFIHNGVYDFDRYLQFFDWTLRDTQVQIDFRECRNANYQALSLFVLYTWYLRRKGCRVEFLYGEKESRSVTTMWYNMGAMGLFHVLNDEGENFHGTPHKPLLAIRNTEDFRAALEKAESYTQTLHIEYEKTLRYLYRSCFTTHWNTEEVTKAFLRCCNLLGTKQNMNWPSS